MFMIFLLPMSATIFKTISLRKIVPCGHIFPFFPEDFCRFSVLFFLMRFSIMAHRHFEVGIALAFPLPRIRMFKRLLIMSFGLMSELFLNDKAVNFFVQI